jgi:hypothetical protein
MVPCWICDAPSDSGEHLIKVTDLKHVFGSSSQKRLYRRINSLPYETIQGYGSEKLKFASKLCSYCNNSRTQQHDRAWEALSEYLRKRASLKPGDVVRLGPVFSSGVRPGMRGVQLYFTKLFGCLAADGKAPIDLTSFRDAITSNTAHPHVYLSFIVMQSAKSRSMAVVTPISVISVNGEPSGASWFYFAGKIGVHVVFSPVIARRETRLHLWHPSDSTKKLVMAGGK